MYRNYSVTVVIPAYNEEAFIGEVIQAIPEFVDNIIVVDDCSIDTTIQAAKSTGDPRLILLLTPQNQGVGGAMILGYRKALELNSQIITKVDGDGQMPLEYLPNLCNPLIEGKADYTKGNRFRDFQALRQMPIVRDIGNIALSFISKIATGYWNCFDPTNGFVAIRKEVLSQLPLEKIDRSYFFEHSMLSHLYLIDAVVQDVPMPARYGNEMSTLSIKQVLWEFPRKLLRCFFRRLIFKKFIYNFTMESIYLLVGIPMLLLGILYGGYNWIRYARMHISAPTGTVVIPAMLIILGFQILLAAIQMDLNSVPKNPIHKEGYPLYERKATNKNETSE